MTLKDTLRFELGGGFKKLSKEEIPTYDEINNRRMEMYLGGSSPYYEPTKAFCFYIRNKYLDDEEFIQVILEHCDWNTFGWALHQIKDKTLYEYAREEMRKKLDGCDEETIKMYLNSDKLPF